jgi:phenylpyruvate tautomerase PptA (4-oxalocrotonate tautomerase family)
MPYLQLDVAASYPIAVKRGLAQRLGALYAEIMLTVPERVSVGFRELNKGGLWRCGAGEPEPAAVLMCDIRRGRPVEQRARLAEALVKACVETLNLRPDRLAVEFTQHSGDEMYRDGQFSTDWDSAEVGHDISS